MFLVLFWSNPAYFSKICFVCDWLTDRRTDTLSYRDARTHQKSKGTEDSRKNLKQEPRGSKDATTLSSLIVHFLLFFVFDGWTDRRTVILMSFWIVLDCLLVHGKFRRHRNIGKDVFRRSKITRDIRTDGRTDRRTDGRTDGHDLL